MIKVRRLGHATLTTPDLDRQVAYYTAVVGLTLVERDAKRAFLASKQGLEAIALEGGPPNALSRLAFQVAPGSDLAELARELAKHGIKSERRSCISSAHCRSRFRCSARCCPTCRPWRKKSRKFGAGGPAGM